MDKRGIIKLSVFGLFVFVIMFLSFIIIFSYNSSAIVNKNLYSLGENVKIDLESVENYKLKIITPSTTYFVEGSNEVFSFKPEEVGKYKVQLSHLGKREKYDFEVVSSKEKSFEETEEQNEGVEEKAEENEEVVGEELIEEEIEKESVVEDEEIVGYSIGNERIEIGKPVVWKFRESFLTSERETNFKIPFMAYDISVSKVRNESLEKIDYSTKEGTSFGSLEEEKEKTISFEDFEEIEIQYTTPAAESYEEIINERKKRVIVSSDVHYQKVLAYTQIEEILKVGQEDLVRVFWIEEDTLVQKNVIDSDGNGFLDRVEWIVPHLSEQTFEISIEVLNVQSYPVVGGNWEVRFLTSGNADLKIRAFNGTAWSNSENNGNDLVFGSLLCGNEIVEYEWIEEESAVLVENYECGGEGRETSLVLTPGVHSLEFDFGGEKAYAYNAAGDSARIVSVERVTLTLSGTSATINLTQNQNMSNVVPFVTSFGNGATQDNGASNEVDILYEEHNITARRYGTDGTIYLSIYAVEFDPKYVRVQNGSFLTTGTSDVVSIENEINQSHAALVGYSRYTGTSATTGDDWNDYRVEFSFNNDTSVIAQRTNTNLQVDGNFWIFEALNQEFEVDSYQWSFSSAAGNQTISPVTSDKTFITSSYRGSAGTDNADGGSVIVYLADSTTLAAERLDPDNTVFVTAYVIQFTGDESVQRDTMNFPASVNTNITSITAVQNNLSMAWAPSTMGRATNPGAGTGARESSFAELYLSNDGSSVFGNMSANGNNRNVPFEVVQFVLTDRTDPDLAIVDPQNTTYTVSSVDFNISLNENGGTVFYTLDGGVNNISMSTTDGENYTAKNDSIADGTYIVNYYANDTSGNRNDTEQISFSIDATTPDLTIVSPVVSFISSSIVDFNISLNEIGDSAWYTLNQGNNNFSMSTLNGLAWNATNDSIADGTYTVNFYANDSVNFVNNTENASFTVDTTNPVINYGEGVEADYFNTTKNFVYINVSVTEANEANITFTLHNSTAEVNVTSFTTAVREINFTGLPDEVYTYNVTVTDQVNLQSTTQTRTITLDSAAPSITITEPQDAKTYATNTSLELNVSVFDSLVGLDSCWWNIDQETNNSIVCGNNATFNTTNGNHIAFFYANDSLGNLNVVNSTFAVSTEGPAITLNSPIDDSYINFTENVIFNYTAVDPEGLDTCQLYGNWNGAWGINQTDNSPVNDTSNIFSVNITDGDSHYLWNVFCNDTNGLESFAVLNYSLTIDLTDPTIVYSPENFTDNTEDRSHTTGSPTNAGNAIDEDFVTFAVLDSDPDIDVLYINYTVLGFNATLEYLTDWNIGAGQIQCFNNSGSSWVLVDNMEDNIQTNVTISNECIDEEVLQLRAFRSLTTAFGFVNFYEEQIHWNIFPTLESGVNVSQDSIFMSVVVEEENEANITFTLHNSTAEVNVTSFNTPKRNINFTNLADDTYTYNVTITDLVNKINTTQTRTITLDTTNPNGTLISPENASYQDNSTQNFTINVSDNIELDNATLFVFNETGDLVNQTSVEVTGVEAVIGIVVDLVVDGVYTWFYELFDIAGNFFSTENNTVIIDETFPLISYGDGVEANGTEFETKSVFMNVTYSDDNFANVTFLLFNQDTNQVVNESVFTTQETEVNFTDLNGGNVTYLYNVTITDLASNSNTTETRSIKLFDSISPGLTLVNPQNTTYFTNVSIPLDFIASDNNLDSCWYTLDSGVNNISTGCVNITFDVADGEHTLFLYINDTVGFGNSSNVTFVANSSLFETLDYLVQRGSTSFDGQSNVTLAEEVDRNRAFIVHGSRDSDSGPDTLQTTARMISNSIVQFDNFVAGGGVQVEYEVITGPDITVQRNEISYSTIDLTVGQEINPINFNNTFIIVNNRLNDGTNSNNYQGFWRGNFVNSSYVEFNRGASGTSGVVSWQVVTWEGANVQNGSYSSTGTGDTNIALENEVVKNNSFIVLSSSTSAGRMDNTWVQGHLINSTTISLTRQASSGGTMGVEWFVVESSRLLTQQGFTAIEAVSTPTDQAISEVIALNKTFNNPYWSSSGGNTYARSFITSELTNTTNDQLLKDAASGPTQNLSWQIIEILDTDPPVVELTFPENGASLGGATIEQFNYTVNDTSQLINCSLYGDWTGTWHLNQTDANPSTGFSNFSAVTIGNDGTYFWNVECFDSYGNSDFATNNYSFFLDINPPLINYNAETAVDYANLSQDSIYINVSVTEANEANITFLLFNSTGLKNRTVYTTPVREINFTSLLDGNYTYNVTVIDIVNQENTTQTRTITLDTTNPNGTLISPENASYQDNSTQNFTINVSDNIELDNATLFVFNETGDLVNQTSVEVTGVEAVIGIVVDLVVDGVYTWFYELFDIAGNFFSTENNTVIIDETFPLISFNSETEVDYANLTQDSLYVNVSVTEANEANITFRLHNSTAEVNVTSFTTAVREINFTGLPDEVYTYNVTVFDLATNSNFTETRTVTLDDTEPVINIVIPSEGQVFGTNVSIPFNVSVSDNLVGLDSCWWNIDDLVNNTITCGNNATFNATDGAHFARFYANDSFGNLAVENNTFSVSTQGPAITLNAPGNNSYLNYSQDIIFNYTATDPDGLDTCSLYGNWAAGWHVNQTDSSPVNATSNIFSVNITNGDGNYVWNVFCNDTFDLGRFSDDNFTFTVDTNFPLISYGDGTELDGANLSQNFVYINVSVTEANEANITFRLFNTSALVNESTFTTPQRVVNFTNLPEEKYFYDVSVTDLTNKQNSTETRSLTLDITPPGVIIDHPQNISYSINQSIPLNFSVSDLTETACWYNIDHTTNITLLGCNNVTFNTTQGDHTLYLFANDSLGNINSSESVSFNVDSVAPIVNYGDETEVNYANVSQNFVYINVSVTEANEANITFLLFNSTGLHNSTTFDTPIRTINFTDLENDVYTYNVTVFDFSSNDDSTETRTITLDTVLPNSTLLSPENNTFSGSSQNLSVNATDDVWLSSATLLVHNSTNELINRTSVEATGTESIIGIVHEFPYDDVYLWSYEINDSANNIYFTENRTLTADTSIPLISYGDGTAVDYANVSQNFVYINVSVTELSEANITFRLLNSTGVVNITTYNTSVREVNFTGLPDEIYTYNVTVVDLVSNENSTENRQITLDTTNPNGTLINPENNTYTSNTTQNFTINASDNTGLLNATLSIFNETGSLINQTTVEVTGTEAVIGIVVDLLIEGVYTWFFNLFDITGNLFESENNTLIIDTTFPLINYEPGTESNGTHLDQDSIFVSVNYTEDNLANITYTLFNSTGLVNETNFTSENFTFNWSNLPSINSTYFFNVTVTDLATNINFTETRTVFLADTNGTTITFVEPQEKTYSTNVSLDLNVSLFDRNGVESCWWNLDEGANNSIVCGMNTTFNATDGPHNITFFSNDTLGNINSEIVFFSISTTGPAITLVAPVDHANLSSVSEITYFNYTAIDPDGVDTCSLYGNWTGTWHLNQTKTIGWWDSNWLYRKNINVSSVSGSELVDFPIYLNVTIESEMQSDFDDLRFINGSCDSNETLALIYEIEYNNTQKADIWLNMPVLPSNGQEICMYYGNTDALNNQSAQDVWDSFYEGVYHLNHTSGSAIDYSVSNSCNAGSCDAEDNIEPDSYLSTQGIVGRADRFDGDDYLGTNPEWDLDSTNGAFWTSCVWINYTVLHDGTIFEDGGNSQGHGMAVLSSGSLRAADVNTDLQAADSPLAYNDGEWHHACGVCESTAGTMTLFVDGVQVAQDNAGVNCAIGGGDARIGQGNGGNSAFDATVVNEFNGTMDELRLSNVNRSEDWINQSYQMIANQGNLISTGASESYDDNSFFTVNITTQSHSIWNVECNDTNNNQTQSFSNFTFALFLTPNYTELVNANQTANDGTGNVELSWNSIPNAVSYRIYHSSNLTGNFTLLNETSALNYTDTTFSGNKRRFYRIDSWNPTGQNASPDFFGSHVYTLEHNGNTRNWIGFPTNATYLVTANQTLNNIINSTAFTYWNATRQGRVTCNAFSCPDSPSCTDTNCNFDLEKGKGYETNINSSSESVLNWSLVGIVYNRTTIELVKNETDFGKNWLTFYANTTLAFAHNILLNITNSDAVSAWNSNVQSSEGLIENPFPFGPPYLGNNFSIVMEKGYEISVTDSTNWTQV